MNAEQANVKSFQALIEFNRSLAQFRGESQQALDAITREIRRVEEWLDERQRYWRHQVEHAQETILQTRRNLEDCRASGNHDSSDTRGYNAPDCIAYEERLSEAYHNLRHAEEELQNVIHWRYNVNDSVRNYLRQSSQLLSLIHNEVPKGAAFLGQKITQLEEYQAEQFESIGQTIGIKTNITKETKGSLNGKFQIKRTLKHQILQGFREGEKYGVPMMQGKAGERVTLLYGNSLLDEIVGQLDGSLQGAHFKIYDIIGKIAVGSVKVRAIHDKSLSKHIKSLYIKDFYLAIGQDDEHRFRFESAAELLLEAKQKELIPIPVNMKQVETVEEMKSYLRQYGELYIPDNHVEEIRTEIQQRLLMFPENFGFKKLLTNEEIKTFVYRVRPIGVTSTVIGRMLDTYLAE